MSIFIRLADATLGLLERLGRKNVPELSSNDKVRFIPAGDYYFTYDPSPRLRQRLKSILKFDRRSMGFWCKRRQLLRSPERKTGVLPQSVIGERLTGVLPSN